MGGKVKQKAKKWLYRQIRGREKGHNGKGGEMKENGIKRETD